MDQFARAQVVGVTGHQPPALGGYGRDVEEAALALARAWLDAERPSEVVSGMAAGWDMAMAEAAVDAGVPLVAALAFRDQGRQWPDEAAAKLARLLDAAALVHVVAEERTDGMWARRDRWVVDRSDAMVALWSGAKGGTADAVRYAAATGKPIVNLWSRWNPPAVA